MTGQMDSAKPLKRNSRMTHASRIFSEIRRDILSGKLEPGVRIKTVTVSERFGVGLSPLREALNRLASEGLITQSDRRGFSVPQVSEAELADITRTRIELHGLALAASIDQGDSVLGGAGRSGFPPHDPHTAHPGGLGRRHRQLGRRAPGVSYVPDVGLRARTGC